jgi:hypothetical protein
VAWWRDASINNNDRICTKRYSTGVARNRVAA